MVATPRELFERRRKRTRSKLRKHNQTQPRLSVFRSSKHMYAQIIDDLEGKTLVSASTLEKDVLSKVKNGGDKKAAGEIGKLIAERAKAAGVESVMFDRGGYLFHGRVKSLADAAREAGLSF